MKRFPELGDKSQRGSKPRCHLFADGGKTEVAGRLTALVKPYGSVSMTDQWMSAGFDDVEEAQLHEPNALIPDEMSRKLKKWWFKVPGGSAPNWDIVIPGESRNDEQNRTASCSGPFSRTAHGRDLGQAQGPVHHRPSLPGRFHTPNHGIRVFPTAPCHAPFFRMKYGDGCNRRSDSRENMLNRRGNATMRFGSGVYSQGGETGCLVFRGWFCFCFEFLWSCEYTSL